MDDLPSQILNNQRIARLLIAQIYARWLVNGSLWLTVGSISFWKLRDDISLWLDFFTWAAVRNSLQNNRLAFLGLGLCIGMTLATLVWQSSHILFGIGKQEYRNLNRQVTEILAKGESHPLWKWVGRDRS